MAAESGLGTRDIDRPLTPEGVLTVTRVGKLLHQQHPGQKHIVSSHAHRAHSTAKILAMQYNQEPKTVLLEKELYEASVRTFLSTINAITAEAVQVIIVAHNPTISYLAEYLSRGEIGFLTPGSVVHLSQEAEDWMEWSEGTATFHQHIQAETAIG